MESNVNKRVKELIIQLQMKDAAFARTVGVDRNVIYGIVNEKINNPSVETLIKILDRYPLLNLEWLLLGKGQVWKSNPGLLNVNGTLVAGTESLNEEKIKLKHSLEKIELLMAQLKDKEELISLYRERMKMNKTS